MTRLTLFALVAMPVIASAADRSHSFCLDDYIGHRLVNDKSESLGTVKDVVLDARGVCQYLIVDRGGILVDKYVAVPRTALSTQYADKMCVLKMTADQFKEAPFFERANYDEKWTMEWCQKVENFFSATTANASASDPDRKKEERINPEKHELFYMSRLKGATVQNKDQEKLGKVENVFSRDGVHADYYIISRGGVLSVGAKRLAVPFAAPAIRRGERGSLYALLDITSARLESAPFLERDGFGELNNPEWIKANDAYFADTRRN